MNMAASPLVPTIIIVEELNAEARGYPLKGREFVLMEPNPRLDEAVLLDGTVIRDRYWVVSKEEYMRVVPEARGRDFDGDAVYFPLFVAKPSFRPCYIK
jgi:hypothetical protein